jgi:hypothetical protein
VKPVPDEVLREVAGTDPHHTFSYEPFAHYGGVWHRREGQIVWDPPMTTVYCGDVAAELLAAREALRKALPILEMHAGAARMTYMGPGSGPADPFGPLVDAARRLLPESSA